jgi:hypothetical protein
MKPRSSPMSSPRRWAWLASAALGALSLCAGDHANPLALGPSVVKAQDDAEDKFPKFEEVSKGYEKVVSTADGEASLYTIWTRSKDNKMLAELPRGWDRQKHFVAVTVGGGDVYAGLHVGDQYVYWKRIDKRMVMIQPNVEVRSTGDQESKDSVERLFTDRVLLDVPIVCMGPSGQPVIDMRNLLVNNAGKFFAGEAGGANGGLATIAKAKAFPHNVELAFQMPVWGGTLRTFHYSISLLPDNTGYKPREADERIGFFTTVYRDLGKFRDDKAWVRYINRWNLEKRDPSRKLSPPKEPIVWYVDHAMPVRYRRWIKQGIDYWNSAFEKVGIVDAIQVVFQDKETGAHMDKDPEDVRYNFIRWLSNDQGTSIGPSRVHPMTGQILDADVVLTDGFIRAFWTEFNEIIPEIAMEGMTPETLAWLDRRPQWDPRLRLAPPEQRDYLLAQRAKRGVLRYGGHPAAEADPAMLGNDTYDGLYGRVSQVNGMCMASKGLGVNMAMMRMYLDVLGALDDDNDGNLPQIAVLADDGVSGTWACRAVGPAPMPPDGVEFSLEVAVEDGNSVSGRVTGPMGDEPITGQWDPQSKKLSLNVDAGEEGKVNMDLAVNGAALQGDAKIAQITLKISGNRTAVKETAAGGAAAVASAAPTEHAAKADDKDDAKKSDKKDKKDEDAKKDDDKDKKDEAKPDKSDKPDMLDGIPEWYVGPALADLVAHEVGHCLGLRHNFKASSIYTMDQINSTEWKGKKPITGSVMEYNPVNIRVETGTVQGDFAMNNIGPYDKWVIEYGYTFDDPKKVASRASDPELAYATDEDTWGPDPTARRWDLGADPLDYAKEQIRLAKYIRGRIIDKFVKDGDSWSRARRGYQLSLAQQVRADQMMAGWIGGTFVNRDKKGDPNARKPLVPVPAAQQRAALKFVLENTFRDESFGLTSDLLQYMTVDKWWDAGGQAQIFEDNTWPVHDRIGAIQASVLTMVMNPTVMRRVYDNEFRTPVGQDALTLPELVDTLSGEIFSELKGGKPSRQFSAREPMISSLRRNLQTEMVDRLIDLTFPDGMNGPAGHTISSLAIFKLREIRGQIKGYAEGADVGKVDPYTLAHLNEAAKRIDKALDAQYIFNTDKIGMGGYGSYGGFGQPTGSAAQAQPAAVRGDAEPEPSYLTPPTPTDGKEPGR